MEVLQKVCNLMVNKNYKGDISFQKTIIEHSKDFHIFYTGDKEPVRVCPVYEELEMHLDTPFEYCWFEFGTATPLVLESEEGAIKILILGILIEELEPKVNRVSFILHIHERDQKSINTIRTLTFKNGLIQEALPEPLYVLWASVYQHLIGLLLNSRIDNTTYINSTEYLKYSGRCQGKYISKRHKINQIVYLRSRKYVEKNFPSIAKNISYTHSWEVMGHWRTLPAGQIGKDRRGIPCIKGYCWVIPHVKGKGDLIKKPRKIVSTLIEGEHEINRH